MTIDIGLLSYGRLLFIDQCVVSILEQTKTPYKIYIANNFCNEEPEIEDYLIDLLKEKIISGLILIKGNTFSNGFDLLYQHFLKSNPFVMSDADLVLPKVDYCWLEYCSKVLATDREMAFTTIRSSLLNIGTTGQDIYRRTHFIGREGALKYHNNYKGVHPKFDKIGMFFTQGIAFQTFNRFFYEDYLKRYKRMGYDSRIQHYASRRKKKWGTLLDDCMHLEWQVEEEYPYYVKHKEKLLKEPKSLKIGRWASSYSGVDYEVLYPGGKSIKKRI